MITSWADLKALAIRYQQGYVKSENFTYGVVSEFGCMSIMITSPTDFNTFATKVRMVNFPKLERLYSWCKRRGS